MTSEKTLHPDILPGIDRAQLGEGPWWDGHRLAWVDILGKRLNFTTLDGTDYRSHPLPQMPGFAVPDRDGGWIAGFPDGLYRCDSQISQWQRLWQAPHPTSTHRLNDGKCDPAGRIWFGSMTYAEVDPVAALYCYDRGSATEQRSGVVTSNGLDWSPDHRTFYYTDSIPQTIWAYDYDQASGAISNPRVFAQDSGQMVPDGGTIDADGCFWSAKWLGGRIVRYTPTGSIDLVWHLPTAYPTSLAFVGDDLSTLAVTTARAKDQTLANELDGSIFLIPTSTHGLAMTPAN